MLFVGWVSTFLIINFPIHQSLIEVTHATSMGKERSMTFYLQIVAIYYEGDFDHRLKFL